MAGGRSPMNDLLHDAVNNRDLPSMKSLVEGGRDLNVRNRWAETPLHLACRMGYLEEAEYLVSKGADTSRADENGNTVLHEAAKSGSKILCEKLIYLLPTLNNAGRSALHTAAENGKLMSVRLFLDHGADPLLKDQDGNTPVKLAMSKDRSDVSQALLNHKPQQVRQIPAAPPSPAPAAMAAPTAPQPENVQSLLKAAREGKVTNIQMALADGADVNSRDKLGDTAMHIAAKRGHVAVINFLINEDGDVSARNPDGDTPLHLACQKGHLEAVRCLVTEKPAIIMVKNNLQKTPLTVVTGLATGDGNTEVYKQIQDLLKNNS